MAPGDRARFLEGFWRRYDPTPGTARNELLEEFLERVDYAKGHFSSFGGGHLSDRGRIYIRFGEPDDLKRELIPEEADRLGSFLSDDAAEDSELKSALAFDRSRPRAYEIWSYFGRGHSLFPDQDLLPGGRAIRFVFVDEQGYGDFRLKHSTEHGAVR
jgi:GWxTD domain-containing protein